MGSPYLLYIFNFTLSTLEKLTWKRTPLRIGLFPFSNGHSWVVHRGPWSKLRSPGMILQVWGFLWTCKAVFLGLKARTFSRSIPHLRRYDWMSSKYDENFKDFWTCVYYKKSDGNEGSHFFYESAHINLMSWLKTTNYIWWYVMVVSCFFLLCAST